MINIDFRTRIFKKRCKPCTADVMPLLLGTGSIMIWCSLSACPSPIWTSRRPVDPLHWRHNDHDGVSNQQPYGCLLNRLFGRKSKKTSKLRVTGLCAGNSPVPVNSPHKGPVTRKMFPFDDVIMRPSPRRPTGCLIIHAAGHSSVHLERLLDIFWRTRETSGLKFGMLMYPSQFRTD